MLSRAAQWVKLPIFTKKCIFWPENDIFSKKIFIQNWSVMKTTWYAHAKKYIFKIKLWVCNFHQILPNHIIWKSPTTPGEHVLPSPGPAATQLPFSVLLWPRVRGRLRRLLWTALQCQYRSGVYLYYTALWCVKFSVVKLREREGQGVDSGRSLKGHI